MENRGSMSKFVDKITRYVILVTSAVVAVLIIAFVLARIFDVLLQVFFIAIVVLSALLIITTVLLSYALLTGLRTFATVRNELNPTLTSVQHSVDMVAQSAVETTETVKDTTESASQTATTISSTTRMATQYAVGPSLRAIGFLISGQQLVRIFLGKGRARRRYEKSRKQQLELKEAALTSEGE